MAGKIKAKAFPRRQPGVMNKLEQRFWDTIRLYISRSESLPFDEFDSVIPVEIRYECQPLKLAARCSYTPDFKIIDSEGGMWFVETKGFWRDDARVKIKAAAEKYWEYRFVSASWTKKDGWTFEEF